MSKSVLNVYCSRLMVVILIPVILCVFAGRAEAVEPDTACDKLLGYYNQLDNYNAWEVLGMRWAAVECGNKYAPEDAASASDYARNIMGAIAARQDAGAINTAIAELGALQNADGSFVNGDNTSLNQTIWAVIAQDFAAVNGFAVNYRRDDAISFICSCQDANGGFDESGWGVDVDSTAHALIALAADYQQPGKEAVTTTIYKALTYLQDQQLSSGGFGSWGSESPDSIAAVIEALAALGIDPRADDWLKDGNNMIDALIAYQSDQGWFVSSWEPSGWNDPSVPNRMTTYHALLALGDLVQGRSKYLSLLPDTKNVDIVNPGGAGDKSSEQQQSTATITICDDAGNTVLQSASWRWTGSCTVLDALKGVLNQQNISYRISGEYVRSIAGLAERKEGYPLSGWLFRINGIFPGTGAGSAIIRDGDQVEWLYTLDGGKDLGAPAVIENQPVEIKPDTDDISSQYEQALGKLKKENLVINQGEYMASAEVDKLRQVLLENRVDISKETGREGGILADSEVFLKIPEGALTQNTRITIKESSQDKPETAAVRLLSSIYEFEPDGVRFNCPVTMAIKLAVTDDIDLDLVAPAWYDTKTGQWIKIPAVIDLKNGLVIFQIDHFTSFALIEEVKEIIEDKTETSQSRLSFDDIDSTFDWAREAIESLAAKGIITGTGTGYEPARSISRAEVLELLVRAKGTTMEKADPGFKDINPEDWCYAAIAAASRQGWISGYPDSTFRPFNPVSRSEAACLLYRIFSADTGQSDQVDIDFADADQIPGWAREAIVNLKQWGILSGYPDGSFRGENKLSRAEAAVIVYKLTK